MDYSKNNDFGGKTYSPELERVIIYLSTTMRNRSSHLVRFNPSVCMRYYNKMAAVSIEAAARINRILPSGLNVWLHAMTGISYPIGDEVEKIIMEEISDVKPERVLQDSRSGDKKSPEENIHIPERSGQGAGCGEKHSEPV